jgi:hypothetical protein
MDVSCEQNQPFVFDVKDSAYMYNYQITGGGVNGAGGPYTCYFTFPDGTNSGYQPCSSYAYDPEFYVNGIYSVSVHVTDKAGTAVTTSVPLIFRNIPQSGTPTIQFYVGCLASMTILGVNMCVANGWKLILNEAATKQLEYLIGMEGLGLDDEEVGAFIAEIGISSTAPIAIGAVLAVILAMETVFAAVDAGNGDYLGQILGPMPFEVTPVFVLGN